MALNKEQYGILHNILDFIFNGNDLIHVVDGTAGVGKSYIIKMLHNMLKDVKVGFKVMAPTGKAASNLGYYAKTIHSQLYDTKVYEDPKTKEIRYSFEKRDPRDIRLEVDLFIIDEGSMVSYELLMDLLAVNVPIIIFGDSNQLEPVSDTNFNVMTAYQHDTIRKVVRTSEHSGILKLAYSIIANGKIVRGDYGDEVEFISKRDFDANFIRTHDIDVMLCGTNANRKKLNDLYRSAKYGYNAGMSAQVGERLICGRTFCDTTGIKQYDSVGLSKANYASNTIYNGETCTVSGVGVKSPDDDKEGDDYILTKDSRKFQARLKYGVLHEELIEKDDKQFFFGYAMTAWKAQGSEFDNVVIFNDDVSFFANQMKYMYTCVTRAKKKIWIVE